MKSKKTLKSREGQKGSSLLETIPMIMVLGSLLGFLMGFWGVTHRHVLHSIAARAYAFETFRNRSNLTYFIDFGPTASNSYHVSEMRYHAIRGAQRSDFFIAGSLPIRFPASDTINEENNNRNFHGDRLWQANTIPDQGNAQEGASPVWIMVGHGICLNANCGGGP